MSNLLVRGSVGPSVTELQNDLIAAGFSIKADGVYGASTEQAVRDFQHHAGLTADGACGPNTFAKLKEALEAHHGAPTEPAAEHPAEHPAEPPAEHPAEPAAEQH